MNDGIEVYIGSKPDRDSILKEYYSRYLIDVRQNKQSTVKHYLDALNNVSRRLKSKQLVSESIYEVADVETLYKLREILFNDSDFKEADAKGRRMYSAGLNNYCRFASGEGFGEMASLFRKLDVPIAKEKNLTVKQTVWKRSGIIRLQSFELAQYKCELDNSHETFIANSTKKPYMEGHHAIPMNFQDKFKTSLDVYANIICLCPTCHRKIHYGISEDKNPLLDVIYYKRAERMADSGIRVSKDEFKQLAQKDIGCMV